MVSVSTLLMVALSTLGNAAPLVPRVDCATGSGVYIIEARGTYEGNPGRIDQVATLIKGKYPGSVVASVNYPASAGLFFDPGYNQSVSAGVNDTKSKIADYVSSCGAKSRIVLLGFSQGGNVMTDTLAGGPGKPARLAETYRANIAGVAVFGDPTFTKKQTFNGGTSTKSGIFVRSGSSLTNLKTYAKVVRSYCDENDEFCSTDSDKQGPSNSVHNNEVRGHADEATAFIASLLG